MGLGAIGIFILGVAAGAWGYSRHERNRRMAYWEKVGASLSERSKNALGAYQHYPNAHQPDDIAQELTSKGLIEANVGKGYHLTPEGREAGFALGIFAANAYV